MEILKADELLQPALPCGLNAVRMGKVGLAPRRGSRRISRSRVGPTCPSVGELLDAGCGHALLEGPIDVLKCLHTRQARILDLALRDVLVPVPDLIGGRPEQRPAPVCHLGKR
jgi:hypothetical protein